jgi:hypothetical protein
MVLDSTERGQDQGVTGTPGTLEAPTRVGTGVESASQVKLGRRRRSTSSNHIVRTEIGVCFSNGAVNTTSLVCPLIRSRKIGSEQNVQGEFGIVRSRQRQQ